MSANPTRTTNLPIQWDLYEIRILGSLDPRWTEWFEGLTVTNTNAHETILSGRIVDQAALHGVLARIRDLNLTLLSMKRIEPDRE
jgi:hypothetical protein